MNIVVAAIVVLGILGALFGLVLAVASKIFEVKKDPREEADSQPPGRRQLRRLRLSRLRRLCRRHSGRRRSRDRLRSRRPGERRRHRRRSWARRLPPASVRWPSSAATAAPTPSSALSIVGVQGLHLRHQGGCRSSGVRFRLPGLRLLRAGLPVRRHVHRPQRRRRGGSRQVHRLHGLRRMPAPAT